MIIKKGDYVFHQTRGIYGIVVSHPNYSNNSCVITDLDKELIGVESLLTCKINNLKKLDDYEEDQGG